jgi:hypothetical protein
MRRVPLLLLIIIVALQLPMGFAAETPAPKKPPGFVRYRVPEPDSENNMIIEFANSIDGTDGTPQSIGKKVSRTPAKIKPKSSTRTKKKEPESDPMQVIGF